jgi:two-component system, LytTR family, response regulator
MANKTNANKLTISKFALSTSNGIIFLNINDVVFCKSLDNYTEFHMKDNKKVLAIRTLKFVEECFEGLKFIRVHKSYLINLEHVLEYNKKGGEGGRLLMSNKIEILVSRLKKDSLLEIIEKEVVVIV